MCSTAQNARPSFQLLLKFVMSMFCQKEGQRVIFIVVQMYSVKTCGMQEEFGIDNTIYNWVRSQTLVLKAPCCLILLVAIMSQINRLVFPKNKLFYENDLVSLKDEVVYTECTKY